MNHNLPFVRGVAAGKTSLLIGLLLCGFFCFAQSPPSPEAFLGYPLGAHFTPHHQIVSYFREVARVVPEEMRLEQYGTTYEGRPLLLAYVASAGNLRRLEAIRQNNLRLAGVLRDSVKPDEHAPVIVWLSYNVHGNEPASSEAAMKTLYELVNPSSVRAKEWLKNTVVILDPCINPDGRDRYVHWFNDVVGVRPNPDPQSREHQEPWPRGRTNHYNFDLNRDWAWQTQVETQQRLKRYNAWLPQIHVDYHEQGFNNPYYFAPAAEPYHDVITPWQREFQIMIGKNHARYFDRSGWLYFTREEFDLFYPSYGDTYPIYNGGIGMTFEQGGIGAGLAVQTADGDTLTLAQRLEHHFTTGISTIEVAAAHADRLIKEYHNYFTDAVNRPGGEYKAYYLRNDSFGDRLERLKVLLSRNGIEWHTVNTVGAYPLFTGQDYETGRTATFKAVAGDVFVNANQPKSNLLRVLFERQSRISDSITYDITAWSVPYVYGVPVYGLNNYITATKQKADTIPDNDVHETPDTSYAYAIRWTGMGSVRFLAQLLQKGVKVRYAERAFQTGGISFDKGTLLITGTGNKAVGDKLWPLLKGAAHDADVVPIRIASGFVEKGADFGSGLVHLIHQPRVAVMTGEEVNSQNAGEVWHLFEQEIGYPVTLVNAGSAGRIDFQHFDVIILPNGYYRTLEDKNVAESLRNWVREGGRLIALQGAVGQLAKMDWGIRLKEEGDKKEEDKDKKGDDYPALHRYGNRQREEAAGSVPGSIYKVELDNTHPLAFGYPDHYYTLKEDDKVYEFLKDGSWNVGVIRKDGYVSGFTGNKVKEKLKDGLVFGVQGMGRGAVVYMADDPLFRSFWENGKLLFCNAVFLVGQ